MGPHPSATMGVRAEGVTPAVVKEEATAAEHVEELFALGSRQWFRWNYFGNVID